MKRVLLLLVVIACGGSAAPATAPESTGGGGDGEGHVQQMAAPSNQNVQAPHDVRMGAARNELDSAESRVNAAMSDCATACRALESMERAAEHLCALDAGTECGRARQRFEAARDRVRASCGGCR
jgi:TolA-binding protein